MQLNVKHNGRWDAQEHIASRWFVAYAFAVCLLRAIQSMAYTQCASKSTQPTLPRPDFVAQVCGALSCSDRVTLAVTCVALG